MGDKERIDSLEKRILDLERDRKSFFKTGILILGGTVVMLATYIWSTQIG